ncbi:dicarboxylate/amino acid:cation symporter [Stenotrophobium rhamnosiphilum]|uniref:Dicarboxylate/amino acid:cation symporter n=1 Tax=Stenotrophobium rhamnosiphilum TaxID=2029166 RepID=A0A2T5MEI8_9GAMM|nr:dicarboxylate/amino acid:cation symporter [Stenotrophobium rhamnosiphilum]PTU31000.1 dicarboxylate/amino acid:cation symporter [Stenotrophobium rhamnosiphilum]
MKLHWQIAIALGLAAATGAFFTPDSGVITAGAFIGNLFLNALKMLVVPLIVSSLIQGLLSLNDPNALSRMGLKAITYYTGTCLAAVLVGLALINLIQPGIIDGKPAGVLLGLTSSSDDVIAKIGHHDMGDIVGVFTRLIPPNLIEAAAKGDILGLILFSLAFGYFCSRLPEPLASTQRDFWRGFQQVMLDITGLVMKFAPYGVFGLVAKTVALTGLDAIRPLAWFFFAVLAGLATHMFIVLPLTLKFIGRVSPWRHFKAMSPALLTAFSSSSSAATLPVTLDCIQNRAGVSPRVTSFVLPLGATINLDGTALYEIAVVMFIAQAYGLDLSLGTQFMIAILALITSTGVAGIPSASLVAISVILGSVGLPLEGLGVILAVDRILDMCRTAVNVFSDSCGAVVVARLEGEDVLKS